MPLEYGQAPRRSLVRSYVLLLLWAIPVAFPAGADPVRDGDGLPPGIEIDFQGQLRLTENGDQEFDGPVTARWRESLIQADRMSIRKERFVEAEGNVLIVWPGGRIIGTRLRYDLDTERGEFEEASGQVLSEFQFRADRVEKIGADLIRLSSATVTTCTQPTPYWSFAVSSATIRIDGYARMWNVRIRAGKMPVIYLPYLVWPVKEGRALGLLLPELHDSAERGRVFSQALFIPLGKSADLTLEGRYYSKAGFGGGGELRWLPNTRGDVVTDGFYINDEVDGVGRYRAAHRQTQEFLNGFRMIADVNLVSDPEFYTDFEREFNLISSPTVLARLEFARNGRWTSLNVRELRRETLSAELVQSTLPEIEWRGRSRRLGRTPLYLSFESSIASISQDDDLKSFTADYLRADLAPVLSLSWSPTPWLDVTPRVRYRVTHYTQSLGAPDSNGTRPAVDESLTRQLLGYGLDVVGPKIFRIFDTAQKTRYKHTIEAQASYVFEPTYDEAGDIILLDGDVDTVNSTGGGDRVAYGVVQRFFKRRPRARSPSESRESSVVWPDGATAAGTPQEDADRPAQAAVAEPAESDADRPSEPFEVATLEIRQQRLLDGELSRADLDGDTIDETTSSSSPIQLFGRYNPGPAASLDVRGSWDILYDRIADATLSGEVRNERARLRLSVFHRAGLGFEDVDRSSEVTTIRPRDDSTQVRLTSGFGLMDGRIKFDVDGAYDANPGENQGHFPNKIWRLQYGTQCCTFQFERVTVDLGSGTDRREFAFRLDLRGVGKLVDWDL